MRWHPRRKKPEAVADTPGQREADRALGQTEKDLRAVREHHSEIIEEAKRLKKYGERNNFAGTSTTAPR